LLWLPYPNKDVLFCVFVTGCFSQGAFDEELFLVGVLGFDTDIFGFFDVGCLTQGAALELTIVLREFGTATACFSQGALEDEAVLVGVLGFDTDIVGFFVTGCLTQGVGLVGFTKGGGVRGFTAGRAGVRCCVG